VLALGAVTAWLAGRRREPLPRLSQLPGGRRSALLAAGLAGAVLNVAIFIAFQRTTIALVLITFYTFPAMVTVAAIRLYGERLTAARLAALLLSSAGLLLVVLAPALETGELALDLLGVGLALFAAVCQAAFILLSARGYAPFRSIHVATYLIGMAVAISLVLLLVGVSSGLPALAVPLDNPAAWSWVIFAGIGAAAIPTVALLAGMRMVGPTRTAILMTFEPVVGVALAGLLLGERPGPLQLVGGAAVLIAAVVLQLAPRAQVEAEEAEVRTV